MKRTIPRNKISRRITTSAFLLVLLMVSIFAGKIIMDYFLEINSWSFFKKDANDKTSINKEAETLNDLCKNDQDKDHCYSGYFYKLTKKESMEYATSVLLSLQKINPQQTRGCHFMAHKISQAETEKAPDKWEEVIKRVSPAMCTGGFLHGVLEAHLGFDPSFTIDDKTVAYVCGNLLNDTQFGEISCYHSMGHLLLAQTEGNIEKAVKQCNTLSKFRPRYECLSGTFMENITTENLFAHGIVKRQSPWNEPQTRKNEELCRQYSNLPAQACWKELSYLYFTISNNDPKGLYKECQNAPTQIMRDECYIYGAGNLVNTVNFPNARLVAACHQFPATHPLFERCMQQIVGSLMTSTLDNIDRVVHLCQNTYTSYQKNCYSLISHMMKINRVSRVDVQKTCSHIPVAVRSIACPV